MLYIPKEEINKRQQGLKVFPGRFAARIDAGADPLRLQGAEQLPGEDRIHKRLAARKRDSAARMLEENLILADLAEHVFNGHRLAQHF